MMEAFIAISHSAHYAIPLCIERQSRDDKSFKEENLNSQLLLSPDS